MQKETNQHYKKHERIDFQEHGCEHGDSHFPELEQMKQGLFCAAGRFDVRGAMTEIIGKPRGEPQRQDEIHQNILGQFCGVHRRIR